MLRYSQRRLFSSARVAFEALKKDHDIVVIGGGPGGYVAAIKAAQEGYSTACIEKRGALGGTCLNVGCIPSKALLYNSHLFHQVKSEGAARGLAIKGELTPDLGAIMKQKERAVKQLTGGIEMLFKKYGVTYYKGEGSFVDEHQIHVDPIEGGEEAVLNAKNVIIATGSESTPFPGIEIDEERIVTSTGALSLKEIPKRLAVIGGGVIGLEMASVWSSLGSEVTVLEFAPSIGGAGMDGEVSKSIQKIFKKQGIKFQLGAKVQTGVRNGDVVDVTYEDSKSGKTESLEADVLLVCVGRRPYTANLGAEKLGIEFDKKGRVVIDSEYKTKFQHIQCIGDCTFGAMLAHKAEEEGIAAVEYIKNGYGHVNYGNIPAVMYTHPEVAWTGASEEQLKEAGIKYKTGKYPFIANSRAKTNNDADGFVKYIADADTHRVLGVHIIGSDAGELIGQSCLALEYGASTEDIERTCMPHPTLSEAVKEGAMTVFGKPINF